MAAETVDIRNPLQAEEFHLPGDGSLNGEQSCDPFGFPFEQPDEFKDAPLEFEELTETLWEDLTDTYILSTRYNRKSPYYIFLCARLEKDIRQIGSLCVTKAVLEQKNMKFPKLEGLTVKELYRMVSLHFRKCHAAFQDLRREGKGIDMDLMDWVCRWGLLAERLKATEEKIVKLQSGKISADSILERSAVFSGQSNERRSSGKTPQEIREITSLPVMASYARELVRKKRQEEIRRARDERERKKMGVLSGAIRPAPMIKPVPIADSEKLEKYFRRELLADTRESGDKSAAEEIKGMDLEELKIRYLEQMGPKKVPSQESPPLRTGPSEDVRRKLRAKRKKKK